MTKNATITPEEFQEICDHTILAVAAQSGRPSSPAEEVNLQRMLISDIRQTLRRRLGEDGSTSDSSSSEQLIEEIVDLVAQHWSSPILVENIIRESMRTLRGHQRL